MYSTFEVDGSSCLLCNNRVMSELGKIQGVFGAEVDFVNRQIVVTHTDEVTRKDISQVIEKMGFRETGISFEY